MIEKTETLSRNPEEIVRKVLAGRGITGDEAVREYLSEKPKLTYDPLLLPDMEAAADFLTGALQTGKKICVYGDYDVDGVTGTALLVSFLRGLWRDKGTVPAAHYIPSRIEEGYGLNKAALRTIRERGADVVVTVDCGSVSIEEARFAREIGLGILITDHHEPRSGPLGTDAWDKRRLCRPAPGFVSQQLPDCFVVNPKREGSLYPFTGLCGCAVAFKLACAVYDRLAAEGTRDSLPPRAWLTGFVDLVALATVADVVPLIDENRTFVKYGLAQLRKGRRPALNALFEAAEMSVATADAHALAFGIAPRINAIGRLGDASEGVELFITGDEARRREIAADMNECNAVRREIQNRCFADCMELAAAAPGPFLLLRPAFAHEGVSGIVAGQVREKTGLPCAVLAEANGAGQGDALLKGSARSAGRLDLITLLRRHEALFERVGGHRAAAGFTICEENEEALREALCRDLSELLETDETLLTDERAPDIALPAAEVDLGLARALSRMAPFGAGNPEPLVAMRLRADQIEHIRTMGAAGNHVRFDAAGIPAVWFGGAAMLEGQLRAVAGQKAAMLEMTGTPEENVWNGASGLQFSVATLRLLAVQ